MEAQCELRRNRDVECRLIGYVKKNMTFSYNVSVEKKRGSGGNGTRSLCRSKWTW